jgi:hypothetical protein
MPGIRVSIFLKNPLPVRLTGGLIALKVGWSSAGLIDRYPARKKRYKFELLKQINPKGESYLPKKTTQENKAPKYLFFVIKAIKCYQRQMAIMTVFTVPRPSAAIHLHGNFILMPGPREASGRQRGHQNKTVIRHTPGSGHKSPEVFSKSTASAPIRPPATGTPFPAA